MMRHFTISSLLWCLLMGAAASSPTEERRECPRDCVCEDAPMRAASFVLTWMTSWGEDDLPEVHPNEAVEVADGVKSTTAADAGVNVDTVGLHATCALMADTNLTNLLQALPSRTMVLSVLQAAGSKLVVLEAEHLSSLSNLRALHLQGYAVQRARQVSGYMSNRVLEMVDHKKKAAQIEEDQQNLTLAISEDALMSLNQLQLLDLQFVRLVAAMEGGRPRRQTRPLATSTLLDVPLSDFLSMTDQVPDLNLPPELKASAPVSSSPPESSEEILFVPLDGGEESVVPYEVFKAESETVLAPFAAQSELKYLRVAHAKLDRVGPELLTGLSNLHTLTLEHNHIKILPPAMFTPTPNLRHLSLAHNNILALEGESLAGLDNLLTLDLDSNKLDRLGPASFPGLPSIATIRMINNPLTHIFPFTFSNVNGTEQLFIGSRDVSAELHTDTFRELDSLTTLVIENTTLLSLSRAMLEGMPTLRDLTIHGHVTYIDFDAFTATPNLETLTLSHCHLKKLSLDAFFGLKNLQYLDLSHNGLDEISPGTFDHLSSLRELYLHHNNLTTLPLGIFVPTPVKLIQLHENPWHCTCDLMQLRPTLTNKVRRRHNMVCRWNEKLGTVCSNERPVRLRYDNRVAPLCNTPSQFQHNDIFQVTHKRLKCPKHLWDPRPKHKKITTEIPDDDDDEEEENEEEIIEEEEPNWLPLTAFASAPREVKDLLEIAEAEMPEDTYAPLSTEDESAEIPQRDEADDTSEIISIVTVNNRQDYRRQKEEMKRQMEEERRKAAEIKLMEKQQLKLQLSLEKQKMKEKMAAEMELERQRKRNEMEEFLKQQELHRMMQERDSNRMI